MAISIALLMLVTADAAIHRSGNDGRDGSTDVCISNGATVEPSGTRGGIKVAVEQDQAIANNAGGADDVVTQLNDDTHFDFTATQVDGSAINTVAKLSNYDVVVIGDTGHNNDDHSTFQTALKNWVWDGGGVISTGWIVYSTTGGQDIDFVIPVNAGAGYQWNRGQMITIIDQNHPVTSGVNNFVPNAHVEYSQGGVDQGTSTLAKCNNQAAVVVGEYGDGRIVYLGPLYMASDSYGTGDLRNGNADRLMEQAVAWATGISIPEAEEVILRDPSDGKKTCYAEHRSYNLSVNISSDEILDDVADLAVYLDYNTTNATLTYNWTRNEFNKLQDPEGHVKLIRENCSVSNNGVDMWWVNFSLTFNFTFPHEELVDCFTNVTAKSGEFDVERFPRLFRVENDFELSGTPVLTGEYTGELNESQWCRGRENITVTGLKVRYQDSSDVYPVDDFFNVKIMDSSGKNWWDNDSSGRNIFMEMITGNVTNSDEEYIITIEDIPGKGLCQSNITFPLKIDAEAPRPPTGLTCHADDFDDREPKHTKEPKMFVTWEGVEDNASGLKGYYYSRSNNTGTTNGTFINYTQVLMENLAEGYASIYVWCIDNVGNIGRAATSGILVDLTSPVFTNLTPEDGKWYNQTLVECSAEIWDREGSGVDGNTIEYSVSMNGKNNYNMWLPAWRSETGERLISKIDYHFQEGTENYIKWRAMDITGNEFVESSPVNIRIDTTPIEFGSEITPTENWYDHREITSKIAVHDNGIGIDPGSLEVRISTSGPGDFGAWMNIGAENITVINDNDYEITVSFNYGEGKDNFIMFRGTDLVGNPTSSSDKFNIRIDTSQVFFGDLTPDEETASDEPEVECFITIYDDGAGVDPGTVEYSVSTEGADEDKFGPWEMAANVVAGNPTQVLVTAEFDWGMDNFIRWRADDRLGTGKNVSEPYRIWVNSEPEAVIHSPVDGENYYIDSEIIFNSTGSTDLDGDDLTYFWTSNIAENRSLGAGPELVRKLVLGNHTITLHVSDGHGYNVSASVRVNVGKRAEKESPDDIEDILFSGSAEDNPWLWIVIGAALLALLIVLMIFLFMRKKKKEKEEQKNAAVGLGTPSRSSYGPQPSPYSQGQYMPVGQGGYSQQGFPVGQSPARAPYQGLGMGGAQQRLALPPGPQPAIPGTTFQSPQPQVPQYSSTLPQGQGTGTVPAGSGEMTYSLPSFTTELGDQNLNRMALPPGPDDLMPGLSCTPGGQAFPSIPAPETLSTGDMSSIAPSTPEPTTQTGIETNLEPIPPGNMPPADPTSPEQAQQQGLEGPPGPELQPSIDNEPPLAELDAFLAAAAKLQDIPAVPDTLPSPPAVEEIPGPTEITMQCHSCANTYKAEVPQVPVIVTCPHCQAQGMIESLPD